MEMASKLTLTYSLEKNENKDIKFLWKHRVFFNFIYDLDKSILTFAVSCNFHLCLELYNKIFCRVWFLQPFAVVSQPQVIRCFLLPLKSSTQKIAIKKIAAKNVFLECWVSVQMCWKVLVAYEIYRKQMFIIMVRYNDFKVFKECEKNFSYNQSLTFYNAPSSHFNITFFLW